MRAANHCALTVDAFGAPRRALAAGPRVVDLGVATVIQAAINSSMPAWIVI